jgi:hypothetical protein
MNWDAVGAVAEVIGALAVVLTLIYLAIQMKHSALAVNQAAQQSMVAEMGASMDSLFANPEGAEIWLKGITSYSSLSAVEKVQLTSLLHHFARTVEQAHLSFRVGTFDAQVWQGLEAQTLDVLLLQDCKNGGASAGIGIANDFNHSSTNLMWFHRNI